MLKKFYLFFLLLIIFLLPFSSQVNASNYELTNKDYKIIEKLENRIYNIFDKKPNLDPEKIVSILEKYKNKSKNNRLISILDIVIEDINYDYFLWENYDEDNYTMTKDDCYEGELFDEIEWYCYLENEYDDDKYDDYINENFSWNNTYSNDENNDWLKDEIEDLNDNFWEEEKDNNEDSQKENFEAIYKVNADSITLSEWKQKNNHLEVWNIFTTLIPTEYRWDILLYKTINNPNDSTFAYVVQNEQNKNKWDITINIWLFYKDWKLDKKESIHTIIHEFAHILTLNKTQVRYNKSKEFCLNYYISEWCLNKTSYLNNFITNFWVNKFKESQNDEENDFYSWNENNFVTEYASSNPWEDIAESFTFFVLKEKPTWNSLSDKKILSFYNYKELIILRSLIRNRLSLIKK